jgi:hypothetical protein
MEREGFETNTEKDVDKLIQNYSIIGDTINGYSDMISNTDYLSNLSRKPL